jgi:hypothetical protein
MAKKKAKTNGQTTHYFVAYFDYAYSNALIYTEKHKTDQTSLVLLCFLLQDLNFIARSGLFGFC